MADTTRDADEFEIPLYATTGRIVEVLFSTAIVIFFPLWILSHILGDPPSNRKIVFIITDIIFFALALCFLFSALPDLKTGNIRVDENRLLIKRGFTTKAIPYEQISEIYLTKTLQGRSIHEILVIALDNFSRIYIQDNFNQTPDDIFNFLKNQFKSKEINTKFGSKPFI